MTAKWFTDEDLAANRRGELTERQRDLLRRRRWNARILPIAVCAVLLLALLRGLDGQTRGYPIIVLIFLAIIAVIVVFSLRIWNQVARNLTGRVETLVGDVKPEVVSGGRTMTYTVRVDGKVFAVSRKVYNAFQVGRYGVYYAPRSMTLLSVEPFNA